MPKHLVGVDNVSFENLRLVTGSQEPTTLTNIQVSCKEIEPKKNREQVTEHRNDEKTSARISGFTLIEVLIALAIIAISLTAILKITAQNIEHTQRIKEKTISHWVAMQGVNLLQLNLIQATPSQESSQVTMMLGQKWYWRAKVQGTTIPKMQQITISVSLKQNGPFREELIAFRYGL